MKQHLRGWLAVLAAAILALAAWHLLGAVPGGAIHTSFLP